MPVYEFSCAACRKEFDELVGPHVGTKESDVRCPDCGSDKLERSATSGHAVGRGLTPNQRRRLEDKRGTNRGGAKQRFKQQRANERAMQRRGGRRGG